MTTAGRALSTNEGTGQVVNQLLQPLAFCTMLAAACGAASAAAPQAPPSPAGVVDAFHAALKSGDANAALHQLAADVNIFEQGFVDRTRADYAGAHVAADTAFAQSTDFKVLDRRILWLGDNTACVLSQTRTEGRFEGRTINLIGTETMLLQRAGNGWSITHIHWSAHSGEAEAQPAAQSPADKPAPVKP